MWIKACENMNLKGLKHRKSAHPLVYHSIKFLTFYGCC